MKTLPTFWRNLIIIFLAFHVLFPLRHFFIQGDVRFTAEGGFMAWRVISLQKVNALLALIDGDNKPIYLYPRFYKWQFGRMAVDPYFAWLTAQDYCQKQEQKRFIAYHALKKKIEMNNTKKTYADLEVLAQALKPVVKIEASVVMLGSNKIAYLFDPRVNICQTEYNFFSHNKYIYKNYQEGQRAYLQIKRVAPERWVYDQQNKYGFIVHKDEKENKAQKK